MATTENRPLPYDYLIHQLTPAKRDITVLWDVRELT